MTWLLTVLGASVAGVALLAGRMRAVGVALLVITSFVDPGAVSRGNLPFLEPTVYSSRPDWIDEYRAAAPGRVHTIYQRAQLVLYGTRDAALLHWARRAAVGETLLPSRVDHTWGFGQLPLRGWAEAWTMLDDPDGDARVRRRLADAMNVRHVVFGAPFTQEAVRDGIRPETRWVEQEGAAPRAMLTTRWQVAAGADDARDRLLAGATAVLHAQEGEDAPPVPGETRGAAGAVTALEYDWNRVSIGVRTDAPALLVLTDTWHPGWTAHVDGRETPVLRANWLFRGVLVPAGARRVEMAYEDAGFRRGLLVALVAGALLIALMLGARRLGSEA